MATFTSDRLQQGRPIIAPHSAGEVYASQGIVNIPDTHAADDIIKLCPLPGGCLPVDFKLALEQLDSNATDTLTYSVGILNAAGDDLVANTEFIAAGTAAADGIQGMNSPNALLNIAMSDDDRIVAMKITNVAATKAAGKAVGVLQYRIEEWGV